jgi:hypothetical protein
MRGSWHFIRQARAPHCLQSVCPPGLHTFGYSLHLIFISSPTELIYLLLLNLLITAQEKQFVSGTGVSNIKAKTGRHCSLRWRNMKPEEKKLYEALEEAGHAK